MTECDHQRVIARSWSETETDEAICSHTLKPVIARTKQSKHFNYEFMERGGYIYILTNKNHTVLYTGVTSNLANRLYELRTGFYKESFTSRYNVTKLVYYEGFTGIEDAIRKEKQIKAGSRQKKLDLINSFNPEWKDLSGTIE